MLLGAWRALRVTDSLASTLVSLGVSRRVEELPADVLTQLYAGELPRYATCADQNQFLLLRSGLPPRCVAPGKRLLKTWMLQ
eukprot:1786894-Alexandrium_andersonii.AAC.1